MATTTAAALLPRATTAAALLPRVNVSFSGCGFLGIYHVGSYACWKDHQDRSLQCISRQGEDSEPQNGPFKSNINNSHNHDGDSPCFLINHALGASAGAIVAAALVVDYSPESLKNNFLNVAKDVKSMTFGPFNPKFNVNKMFRDELNKVSLSIQIISAILIRLFLCTITVNSKNIFIINVGASR